MSGTVRIAKGKRCKFCSAPDPVVHGLPPDPCEAECKKCGKRWSVCGANKKNGPDMRSPVPGRNRCKWDGGLSPGRPPTHGRRIRCLPKSLVSLALEAESDPDLISSRDDLVTLDAMINREWEKVRDDDPAEDWRRAAALMTNVASAIETGDAKAMSANLASLKEVLEKGKTYERRTQFILDLMDRRNRSQLVEIKRLSAMNQYVTAQQLAGYFARLKMSVMTIVSDRKERASLASVIIALASPTDGQRDSRDD